MDKNKFQEQVSEGEEWICLVTLKQELRVKVNKKHEDHAFCKILSKPNQGIFCKFKPTHFDHPA